MVTQEQKDEYKRVTGKDWDPRWRSGRSTALALWAISWALRRPGADIEIVDHFPSREANRHTFFLTQELVTKLDLKCLRFLQRGGKYYIRYTFGIGD